LSELQLRGAKLISKEGTEELISERKPVMVVDWEWFCSQFAEVLEPNYRLLGSVGPTLIYGLK